MLGIVTQWRFLCGIGHLGIEGGNASTGEFLNSTSATIVSLYLVVTATGVGEKGAEESAIPSIGLESQGKAVYNSLCLLQAAVRWVEKEIKAHVWGPPLSRPAMHPKLVAGQHAELRPIDAHPMHGSKLRMLVSACSQMAVAKALGI